MQLRDYWPAYLQQLREFGYIAQAEQPELESLTSAFASAVDDFYLETLTLDGVIRWEQIMRIPSVSTDSLEDRRSRVMLTYMFQTPYTLNSLIAYITTISNDAIITVDYANRILHISAVLTGQQQRDTLRQLVEQRAPANMIVDLIMLSNRHRVLAQYTHRALGAYTHEELMDEVIDSGD